MKIGVIGAGNIGGNCARQAIKAGHEVMLSFSRNESALLQLADELGGRTSVGDPAQAVKFADIVIFSVPWGAVPVAIAQAGHFGEKVVVDTTNQFGSGPKPPTSQTAAAFNAERMPGSRYVKSFNTLTAGFQAEAATRPSGERVVQWLCGDDLSAKTMVSELIAEMGYVPVDLGGIGTCQVMEAPRRPGAVYGEEYRASDAEAVVDAVRAGTPIPPTPTY